MCDEAFSVDFKKELYPRKTQPQPCPKSFLRLYVFIRGKKKKAL